MIVTLLALLASGKVLVGLVTDEECRRVTRLLAEGRVIEAEIGGQRVRVDKAECRKEVEPTEQPMS